MAAGLNRRFLNVKISQLSPSTLEVLNSKLKSLRISNCTIDPSLLATTLRNLNSLEVFDASGVEINEDPKETDKVKLKNLTNLRLHKCNISLVSIFDVTSLKSFEISSTKKTECEGIIKLLNKQSCLEELKLEGLLCNKFFAAPQILSFPFRLKKLSITNATLTNEAFLRMHSASLTQLILNCTIQVENLSIHSMPNLTSLEIPFQFFNNNEPTQKMWQENATVKSLKLLGMYPNLIKATNIFKLFPSIDHLDLSQSYINCRAEATNYMHKLDPQLKSLKLPYTITKRNLPHFFPCLATFSVLTSKNTLMDLEQFITMHVATLETIEIGSVKDSVFEKTLIVNKIMNCPNLKAVIIGCESPLVVRMFNKKVIRSKPWTLQANIKSSSTDTIALKFKFPDDLAVWEERCRIYDDELIRDLSTVENSYGTNAFVNKYK